MGDPGSILLLGQHVAEPGLQCGLYRDSGILCAGERGSAASARSRDAWQERHSAGRLRRPAVIRIRIPFQALPLVTGLPAPSAVLAALPLGLLPRPPGFLRPDPLLRAGPSCACSTVTCSSFAAITARSRDTSGC